MALGIVFILLFGTAAAVPTVWAIVGLIRGERAFWPAMVGLGFTVVLLGITFGEMATGWGGCSGTTKTSEGSVQCYRHGTQACELDIWKSQCGKAQSCSGSGVPAHSFCPSGDTVVFPFCETIQPGSKKIMQPMATWSDLSFVAAGMWLFWFFRFFGQSRGNLFAKPDDNPMSDIGFLSIAYCLIVIFMGPPSMWYHASMKQWGGWFDTMSVVAWLGFNAVYVIYALTTSMWGRGRGAWRPAMVLGIWGVLMVGFGITAAVNTNAHLYLYFATGGPWGIAEVVYVIVAAASSKVQYRRTWWLFISNLLLLAATMTLWMFFNDAIVHDGCAGRSGFPGHALFHIMASISTMLTFFSFASERSTAVLNDRNFFSPFRDG